MKDEECFEMPNVTKVEDETVIIKSNSNVDKDSETISISKQEKVIETQVDESERENSPINRFLNGKYQMVFFDKKIFGIKNDVEVYHCPYCEIIIKDENSEICRICKKSLKATQEELKFFLKQQKLESSISILEKQNLLDVDILSKMKEKDYKKIGITSLRDRKKLASLFYSGSKGCLIFTIIIIALILVTILILHHLGLLPSFLSTIKWFSIMAIIIFVFGIWDLFN